MAPWNPFQVCLGLFWSQTNIFLIDIVEEPAAEPLTTHGDGWIPMRIDQVIQTISENIDNNAEVTTATIATTKKRIPKGRFQTR